MTATVPTAPTSRAVTATAGSDRQGRRRSNL